MADIDFDNPWILGAILITTYTLFTVGAEVFLLTGNIRAGLLRGIFLGTAFALLYLFLRSRYGKSTS
ncbi:hypothetical protein [Haloarcula laminariae]|uniref:hypothetical protein n=1 Tax=Haloarcula laminariae TaxID=2961577 RepID=UPI0021C897FA|nr:hypothetical protein [Halomicroarcula laminariae]